MDDALHLSALVSVIVPAYKAQRYILQALETVKTQTYPHWEIIITEDGVQDKTETIVKEFTRTIPHNRIVFLRHTTNKGLASTRNTAIHQAKGEYLAFLDHDDLWMPTYLENMLRVFEKYDTDLVYSTTLMFKNNEIETPIPYGPLSEEIDNFPVSLYTRNFIACCGAVVKRNAAAKVGYFSEGLRAAEDYDCWISLARAGFKFKHIGGTYSFYRKHEEALTADKKVLMEAILFVMKKNRDWSIIPVPIKQKKIAELYNELGLLYLNDKPSRALCYLTQGWLEHPRRLHRTGATVKSLIKAMSLCVRDKKRASTNQ